MHMLFPFRSVCASFVVLRPLGVISLYRSKVDRLAREERGRVDDDVLLGNVFENHVWGEKRGIRTTVV